MNPPTMLAAVFDGPGDPEQVLQLRKIPIPAPRGGEVLVRMQAASVHPADRMFVRGVYRIQPVFPQAAGLVGTGVIMDTGATMGWTPGTRVAFRHPGAWAEYCVVPAARLFSVPDAPGVAAASQFALNPITAWGLLDTAGVGAGDWLALNAARSNVAAMVRALATARGVHIAEIPRAPGEPVADRLLATTGGEPIAGLLDAVGGPSLVEALPALRPGAVIVSYGVLEDAPAPIRNRDLIYRNLSWVGFGIDHWLAQHAAQRDAMACGLWDAMANAALPTPVRAVFPLEALQAALHADAAGGSGKVVVSMGAGA